MREQPGAVHVTLSRWRESTNDGAGETKTPLYLRTNENIPLDVNLSNLLNANLLNPLDFDLLNALNAELLDHGDVFNLLNADLLNGTVGGPGDAGEGDESQGGGCEFEHGDTSE